MPTSPDSLEGQIERELQQHDRLATASDRAARVLSAVAILSSIVAGLSVAAQWFSGKWLAVLSTLPAAMLVMIDVFRLEERSVWHYEKTYGLRALLNQLRFEGVPERDISIQWRHLTNDMERRCPRYVKGTS